MRLGIIGYGSVAAVHAEGLHHVNVDLRVVFGPREEKARAFAERHRIARWTSNIESVFEECEAVVIASPTGWHFHQAMAALCAGRHCLVELPACSSAGEARDLLNAAVRTNVVVQCAHSSRFLEPFIRLGKWVQSGALGEIRHIVYYRSIPPRQRSWVDDAIRHHAAHPLDLLLHWFGQLEPVSCVTPPGASKPQDAALAARLKNHAPVSLNVSYTSCLRETRLTVIGEEHTVATDGFSYISSDASQWEWQGDAQQNYEAALEAQDRAFLGALAGESSGTQWGDTIRLTECVDLFLQMGDSK